LLRKNFFYAGINSQNVALLHFGSSDADERKAEANVIQWEILKKESGKATLRLSAAGHPQSGSG